MDTSFASGTRTPAAARAGFCAAVATTFVGDGVRYAAVALVAVSLTRDAGLIAVVTVASGLPWVVFGLHAGALADRVDPLRLYTAGLSVQAAITTVLVMLLWTDSLGIVALALLVFALQSVDIVTDIASNVLVPRLFAPAQVQRANARLVTIEVVTLELAGPVLAGALFTLAPAAPFTLDLASFAVGAVLLQLVARSFGPRAVIRADGASERSGLTGGFAFLRRSPAVRNVTWMAAALNVGLGGLLALQTLHLTTVARLTPGAIGLVLGLGSIGAVIAGVVADRLVSPTARQLSCVASVPVVVVAMCAFAASSDAVTATLALGGLGAAVTIASVAIVTVRQHRTPAHLMGRVTAAVRLICWGALPAGAAAAGAVAALTTTGWAITGLAVVVLLGATVPAVRLMREPAATFADAEEDVR